MLQASNEGLVARGYLKYPPKPEMEPENRSMRYWLANRTILRLEKSPWFPYKNHRAVRAARRCGNL